MLPIFFSCLFHFISFRSAFVRARARATLSFQFRYTDNSNNNNQIASNANNCKSPCDTFQSVECKTAPFRTVTDFIGKASVWCAPKWNLIWQLLFSRSFSSSLSLSIPSFTLCLWQKRIASRYIIFVPIINVARTHPAQMVFIQPHVISAPFKLTHTHTHTLKNHIIP